MSIIIKLTDKQLLEIATEIEKMYEAEKPGMLLGQIKSGGEMKVGFFPHEISIEIQRACKGIKDVVGKTIDNHTPFK